MFKNKILIILVGCCSVAAQAEDICVNFNAFVPATTGHIIDNNNGTVSDPKTGLVWKKCSEGQSYNSADNSCSGSLDELNWQEALQQAQDVNAGTIGERFGNSDWRVPNIKELASIVERACQSPAINELVFPTTPGVLSTHYWSSTPNGNDKAETVNFAIGWDGNPFKYREINTHVRLVRSGQ